jgi:hypothetical protein
MNMNTDLSSIETLATILNISPLQTRSLLVGIIEMFDPPPTMGRIAELIIEAEKEKIEKSRYKEYILRHDPTITEKKNYIDWERYIPKPGSKMDKKKEQFMEAKERGITTDELRQELYKEENHKKRLALKGKKSKNGKAPKLKEISVPERLITNVSIYFKGSQSYRLIEAKNFLTELFKIYPYLSDNENGVIRAIRECEKDNLLSVDNVHNLIYDNPMQKYNEVNIIYIPMGGKTK